MQAVRGIKPTNLLHTTPVRGSAFCTAVCLFILFPPICIAGTTPTTADAMLAKAQALIDKAAAKATGVSAVPLYDEPLRLLEEITARHPDAKEANIQAEKLKALCYDRQARYAEKHQALKRYADLISGGDKEKAAQTLKAEADALVEAKETTEAVVLYNLIASDYKDTSIAPEGLLSITQLILAEYEHQKALGAMISSYKAVIDGFPLSKPAASACLALADFYWEHQRKQEAFDLLNDLMKRQPNSEQSESALWNISKWYLNVGNLKKAKESAETYMSKYPKGVNSVKAQRLLQVVDEMVSRGNLSGMNQ